MDRRSEDPNAAGGFWNDRLEELIDQYLKENSSENLNRMIEQIRKCRLLMPAGYGADEQIIPCCISGKDQTVYLPVFTSEKYLPEESQSELIMSVPYRSVNLMALEPEAHISGVVVNPGSFNLNLPLELLQQIQDVADREESGDNGGKVLKLTEPQYHIFARKQLEYGTLPVRFFNEGKAFIDRLSEERESLIDQIYEEDYQEKRLYPYCTEDFSVMVMNISEELTVLRVDMPERNMGIPSCYRVYFLWLSKEGKGRYFTVEKISEDDKRILGELDTKLEHVTHQEEPPEGTELQKILDIVQAGGDK